MTSVGEDFQVFHFLKYAPGVAKSPWGPYLTLLVPFSWCCGPFLSSSSLSPHLRQEAQKKFYSKKKIFFILAFLKHLLPAAPPTTHQVMYPHLYDPI